jgi:MPBQ/MSBQ methyltransferase
MPKPKSIRVSQVTRYQNAALNFYLGLTSGSPYLHYGYWQPLPGEGEELTITKFIAAQQAYTDKLVTFIPNDVGTILDVGCGTGGNAVYLLDQGFSVEGLAPDPLQEEKFLSSTQGRAFFHLCRFEDFESPHSYDLVLFSESSQYMAAVDIAQGAARALKPRGYVLLLDMLRSNHDYVEGIFSNCHRINDLQRAFLESGFTLVKSEDISRQIAPTLDLYVDTFRRYGLSTLTYVGDLISIAVPPIYKLLEWISKRWLQKPLLEGLAARKIFDQHLCYQIQLWQLSPTQE